MQTNANFKSFVPQVNDAESMDDFVGQALWYQYMFERKTSPWEMARWEDGELQKFQINLEDVDRLYFINSFNDNVSGSIFSLLIRMIYKEQKVFVELSAGCDYTGFECQGGGDIFVTMNAKLFSKVIISTEYNMELLYRALKEDGYDVDEQMDYDRSPVSSWHNPPMLKFLCHLAINDNKERLQHYKESLPKALVDSVSEFINIRDAIREYDSWD